VKWEVSTLPIEVAEDGPRFVYCLMPPGGGDRLAPPDGRVYARSVRDLIDAEWDDVLRAMGPIVTLLPESVQRRAFGRRGGAAATRVGVLLTAGFLGALGVVMASLAITGPRADPLGPTFGLLGVLLVLDSVWRSLRAARREYAPSLLSLVIPGDLLRPERIPYREHRDAWRAGADQGVLSETPSR
jgi:hypothetical protein